QASAQSLNATYYTVHTPDKDFQTQCCSTVGDLVMPTLSAGGLPVYNPASTNPYTINDLTADGEINWWRAADQTGTAIVALPIHASSMFPPDGSGGNDNTDTGFLTAKFTGILHLDTDSTVTFHLGADDDAFLFIDGALVDSLGGVHGDANLPVTT